MKKLIVGFFLIVAIAGVFYLVKTGVITWQPLTMIIAAVAAPFKFIMSLFGSEEKIRAEFAAERAEEHAHQREFDEKIQQREERAAALRQEVDELDIKLAALKAERGSVSAEVKEMSTEEKQKKGKELLGD
ncbi:hypothetical protein IIA28_15875 [candidate division KSB1 bacterium]|nr:hypothetical protein [candidate division KSB1 bacterium]